MTGDRDCRQTFAIVKFHAADKSALFMQLPGLATGGVGRAGCRTTTTRGPPRPGGERGRAPRYSHTLKSRRLGGSLPLGMMLDQVQL